jgi:uncharacterized membrane protein YeaQ/YmgE (transglycosylase-associated protein family)
MTALGFLMAILFGWMAKACAKAGQSAGVFYFACLGIIGGALLVAGITVKLWEVMP